jgi:hypothetical protein
MIGILFRILDIIAILPNNSLLQYCEILKIFVFVNRKITEIGLKNKEKLQEKSMLSEVHKGF